MDFIQQKIIEKIEEYENIALFFHELPDLDSLGACYGMKRFIKSKFPNKQVEIIGLDTISSAFGLNLFFFEKRHIPNEFLIKSIGIILDTANAARVWSQRHTFCQELIRIDHHPKIETIANYEWVNDNYPSTCQMVTQLIIAWDERYLLAPIAMYLYAGIVTDTGRFLYNSTLPTTYEMAAKLVATNFDRQKIHDIIYLKDIKETKFNSYIIRKTKFNYRLGFAYAKIGKNSFDHYGIDLRISMVHVLNNIADMNIWMTIYYDNTIKQWKGSLRSRNIPINVFAEKYHGGGHKYAAGFTIRNWEEYKQLKKDITNYLTEHIKTNN